MKCRLLVRDDDILVGEENICLHETVTRRGSILEKKISRHIINVETKLVSATAVYIAVRRASMGCHCAVSKRASRSVKHANTVLQMTSTSKGQ